MAQVRTAGRKPRRAAGGWTIPAVLLTHVDDLGVEELRLDEIEDAVPAVKARPTEH